MSALQKETPDGYMKNRAGHLVPVANISEIETFRHDFVVEMVERAKGLNATLAYFKASVMEGMADLTKLSAANHGVKLGGEKGNITLTSFDGQYKVVLAMAGVPQVDERIQVVKAMLNNCLTRFSDGGSKEIKALMESAFKTNNAGMISIYRLRWLRAAKIEDDEWKDGIRLLDELLLPVLSKAYVRVYELKNDKYELIALDLGGV